MGELSRLICACTHIIPPLPSPPLQGEGARTRFLSVAREAHDREDLLRDARALTPRVMLSVPLRDATVQVFAGFRGDALSLYFGGDPVFHFNAEGELRRAFVADRLVRAERGRLVRLERQRGDLEVALVRHTFDELEQADFLQDMLAWIGELRVALAADRCSVVGQVPVDGTAVERLRTWLDEHLTPRVASTAGVGR